MSTPLLSLAITSYRREIVSTRVVFFLAGLILPAWAPLVPITKIRANLDDGGLGLLLFGLGAGSLLAMPFAGFLTERIGCRSVIVYSFATLCVAFLALSSLTWVPGLAFVMVIFGASMGMLDCAINIHSLIVQKKHGAPLQSGFHGLFSLGSICGSSLITLLLSLGLVPLTSVIFLTTVIVLMLMKYASSLLPYGGEQGGPALALPRGVVIVLGTICFIVFLTEGAILDWSAVFLVSHRGMDAHLGGSGYICFAVAVTLGRLSGDLIVQKIGGTRVVVFGGILAALGMVITLAIPHWPVALIGFGLMGVGCSNISPVVFSAVGQQTRMPQRVAVPAVLCMGYTGILMGPALIGFVAHASTLQTALGSLVILLLFVSSAARFIR